MKKSKAFPHVIGVIVALVVLAIICYFSCPAINIHNPGLWMLAALGIFIYLVVSRAGNSQPVTVTGKNGQTINVPFHINGKPFLIPLGILVLVMLISLFSGKLFHAKAYAAILPVQESDFATDLSESVNPDTIALMDTASARKLGDRKIGSLTHVVSQYDVAQEYTQID